METTAVNQSKQAPKSQMNDKSVRFWNRFAQKYSRQDIGDMAAYEKKLAWTREHLTPESCVLEFGCGTGSTALLHAPYVKQILATDYSREMIEIGQNKAKEQGVSNVSFDCVTIQELAKPAESFDAVLGLNVLHLDPQWESSIERSYELLVPGGVFVTSTACLTELSAPMRWGLKIAGSLGFVPYIMPFHVDQLLTKMTRTGFEILLLESPGNAMNRFVIARKPHA